MKGWRSLFELNPAADWPIATVRTFLWDPVNGNDANPGFSDAAGPYTPATQARQTIQGMRAIFPTAFNGRKFRLIMAAGTYAAGLEQLINGAAGIGVNSLIRGTSTNATAGTVAFSDDAADRIYQGWVTATGMNGPGYKPTGGPTTTVVQCLTAAGGAPGFGAEPALPGGVRIRFDAATATAALRNICRSVIQVTGTDTLTLDSALPAVPGATDVFYIEMGGLSFPGQSLFVGSSGIVTTLQLCGFFSTGTLQVGPGDWRVVGAKVNAFIAQGFNQSQQQTGFVETTTGATIAIGGCIRSETTALYSRGIFASLSAGASYTVTSLSWNSVSSFSATGSVARDISNSSCAPGSSVLSTPRTFSASGTAALLLSAPVTVVGIVCTGAGAKPVIAFNSFVAQGYMVQFGTTSGISGSTGNTDVGMDTTGATGCTFVFGVLPTLTGTLGDVRVPVAGGSQIMTWAQIVAGFVDGRGNRYYSGTAIPTLPIGKFSGVMITAGGGATTTYAADYSAGQAANQATAQQYPTSVRLATKLRLCAPSGTPADSGVTATLYKNGVATAMTCTVAANQAAGTKAVDAAHPILFADADTYDVRINGASASNIPFTATVEGA